MASIAFQTDQSGSNTQVCSTSSVIFNFSVSSAYDLGTATFSMKSGSGSTSGVTVAVYSQANGGGTVVASAFIAVASIPQTYTSIVFTFPAGVTLTANQSYSVKISSTSGCGGSQAYFMKSGNFQISVVGAAQILNTGYGIAAAPTAITSTAATTTAIYKISADATGVTYTTAAATKQVVAAASATATSAITAVVAKRLEITAGLSAIAYFPAVVSDVMFAASAPILCEPVVVADDTCNFLISAGANTISQASAAASLLAAGEINKIHHGAALTAKMYLGYNRVNKAYWHTTTIVSAN